MRSLIPPVFVPCVLTSTDCSINTKEYHVIGTRLILTVHLEGTQEWSLNSSVETRKLEESWEETALYDRVVLSA